MSLNLLVIKKNVILCTTYNFITWTGMISLGTYNFQNIFHNI